MNRSRYNRQSPRDDYGYEDRRPNRYDRRRRDEGDSYNEGKTFACIGILPWSFRHVLL